MSDLKPGEFKHEDKVLGVRALRADFTTYNGFKNPTEVGAEVFANDWQPTEECGNGLHWIPWGIGHDGQDHGYERPAWQVVEPIGEVKSIEGKCKSHGVRIVHTGTLAECMNLTQEGRIAFAKARAEGNERSTGYRSSAASTGYRSSAASTGYRSSAASTGYRSSAASTGYRSSAASTGYRSSAASTGYRSSAASTGYRSSAASTGYRSSAASTGYRSSAASTGYRSSAASTGYRSSAASTGYRSSAASTGYRSSAASTGYRSSAASTGYRSSAASTGYRSSAASTGYRSSAASTGLDSKARAGTFSCIALAYQNKKEHRFEMRCSEIGIGDGSDGKLKADTWYSLNTAGEFVESTN